MGRERVMRALAICRDELRKANAMGNRSAAHYWGLQLRDNQQWLKRHAAQECMASARGSVDRAA